jgi:hypothetical protein
MRVPDRRLCLHCYSEFEVPTAKPRASLSPSQKPSKMGAARKA